MSVTQLTDEEIVAKLKHLKELKEKYEEKEAGLTAQDLEVRAMCEASVINFSRHAWNILEPKSREMKTGWALDAMAEHLTAVTNGEINRLVISVPPGFMKSMMTKIFWPAWEWGPQKRPDIRYVTAAYADHLSMRDARKMKLVITSDWYQKLWPHVRLSSDQAQKSNFHNDANGFMLGTSVGGLGTGERGDRFICDDPNSVKDAESKLVRDGTNQWFLEVVPTRLNSEESAILVIQQRTNEDDVTGTILEKGLPYVHLSIPMEMDMGRKCTTSIGWEDPRTKEGELAWPERFPQHVVDELKNTLGVYASSAQLQQAPSPRGGGIIRREWWVLWEDIWFPPMELVVIAVDTAYSEKQEADFSAAVVLGVYRDQYDLPKIMLMSAWQERLGLNDLVLKLAATSKKYKADRLLIEAKASGISVGQEIKRMFGQEVFGVTMINPKGDKTARLQSVEPLFAAGMIFAPDKAYADMVIDQVTKFPKSKNDDLCDALSCGIRWLRDNGLMARREEREADLASRQQHRSPTEALYDI